MLIVIGEKHHVLQKLHVLEEGVPTRSSLVACAYFSLTNRTIPGWRRQPRGLDTVQWLAAAGHETALAISGSVDIPSSAAIRPPSLFPSGRYVVVDLGCARIQT